MQSIDSGSAQLKNFYEPVRSKMHEAIVRKKKKLQARGVAPSDDDQDNLGQSYNKDTD